MILQRDTRVDPTINTFGCYLMSLLWWGNKLCNVPMDPGNIHLYWEEFRKEGWVEENCWINDPDGIMGALGIKFHRTSPFLTEVPIHRTFILPRVEILLFQLPRGRGKIWKHFVAGNGDGVVTYDPWGVSKTATEGICVRRMVRLLKE